MRRRPERALAGLAVAGAVLLTALPTATAATAATPATEEPEPVDGPVGVDDAVLRWGINNETHNRAHAPDTYNFLSAGRTPDPGRGGQRLDRADWQRRAGAVRIEKWDGRSWRRATWAGLSTDSDGRTLGSPAGGTFSNHTFVIEGGEGVVDVAAGTATLSWEGEVSVLYYSGMSFFHLADPELVVEEGAATLTATMSGFASSQADPDVWEEVAPSEVVVADLPGVDVADLVGEGLSAQPAYEGVRVSGVPQQVEGSQWGSFPQSWVDYADRLGAAAFWYSSGGTTDAFKVPLPVSVGVGGAEPETPVDTPQTPAPGPAVPTASSPPTSPPPVATTAARASATSPAATPTPVAAPAAPTPSTGPTTYAAPPAWSATAARPTAATPSSAAGPTAPAWWAGGALLLVAALLLLVPTPHPGRKP